MQIFFIRDQYFPCTFSCLHPVLFNVHNKRDPYKGLFERDGKQFRYTINDTKKEFFNIEETQSYERDGIVYHYNPLHILLCYARYVEPGAWLGDKIRISNDRPDEDYTDISKDIVI